MFLCYSHLADNPDDKECRQILGFTCNGVGVVYIKLRQWEKVESISCSVCFLFFKDIFVVKF